MSLQTMKQDKSDVTDVMSKDVPQLNTDASQYTRLGWIIVLVGFVGFMLWALFAPLDKGVPLSGNVAVAGNRKLIQNQAQGTIDAILVKDGDLVKKGQPLVKMNGVAAESAAQIARVQSVSAKASLARLMAERDGLKAINFPKDLEKLKNNPSVAEVLHSQQQLFSSRQNAMQSELAAFEENLSGLRLQLKGLQESMQNKKQQQQFIKEQVEGVRDLAKDGYVAKNRLLELERGYAQMNGSISEDLGNMGRVTSQIAEISLRKSQRQQEYQKEVRTQLSDVQKEVEALDSRLKALEFDLSNVVVDSPVDGVVVGLNVFTVGGVVPSGYKLMEIVPQHEVLIVEGMLPVQLVDKVHQGLKVDFIFAAFNTNTTPHIPGVITHVAADRSVDERTGQAFYKVKAEVTPEGTKLLGKLEVRPGMPVELFVKTGERTMMNYLMRPVLDRVKTSMKEE